MSCGLEAGLADDLADAAVESLDHAVGLRMARRTQAVLDGQFRAAPVECVFSAWRLRLAGEAVGELTAVVGEHGLDLHRRGLVQATQEVGCGGFVLAGVDAQIDPARGAVDGHEQVASGRLVGHLRQVLDVHMDGARHVVLERLGLQFAQAAHAVALQAAVQARARNRRVDELPTDHEQVIEPQQQQAAQLDHERLLGRRQRGAQPVRAMRAVLGRFPRLPLARGRLRDVVALGQFAQRRGRGLDFGTRARRGSGLRMDLTHAAASCRSDSITPRSTSRALNSGQLRWGT